MQAITIMRFNNEKIDYSSKIKNYKISQTKISLFRTYLVNWYQENGRHFSWRNKSADNYQKIIAEILLQRTRVDIVARFIPKFYRKYRSWRQLSKTCDHELQEFLRPLGLWRARSKTVKKLATEMVKRRGVFPKERNEILALPGIGEYIASAVQLFCYNHPEPLFDVNMARLLERYFGKRRKCDIYRDPNLKALSKVVISVDNPVELNWAILDFSHLICKNKKPLCTLCPLSAACIYFKSNQ
jgi:A/G-specific adenine glycosylase